MSLLLISITMCFLSLVHGQKLHEYMTREEIESVFSVNHKEIEQLKYEVVPIFHRSEIKPRIHFGAFNEDYDLYFENNNHILLGSKTPVYLARRSNESNGHIIYQRKEYPFSQNMQLLHNVERRVAVAIRTNDNNKVDIYGLIGDDIAIRPLPPRIHNEVLSTEPKLVKDYAPSLNFTLHGLNNNNNSPKMSFETRHHVIIKLMPENSLSRNYSEHGVKDMVNIVAQEKIEVKEHKLKNSNISQWFPFYPNIFKPIPLTEFSNQKTIYPEVMIVIDYETYKLHKEDVKNVAHYMAAFWNAVDLRFRELDDPTIRLNIAGLVIPTEPGVQSYLEKHVYKNNSLLADNTVDAVGKYFAKETYFSKDSYDIVVGITNRDLVRVIEESLKNDTISFLYGIAFMEGVCGTEEGYSTALITDKGGFLGITVAAHELAHLMGAPHDGEDSKDVTGGPCDYSDGYLMGFNAINPFSLQWSRCSKMAMQKFLNSTFVECLKNKPDVGTAYPKYLPGRLMSRDEQCRKSFNLPAFEDHHKLSKSCHVLHCKVYKNGKDYFISQGIPPAEGTPCGDKKSCIDGHCVNDPES